MSGDNQNINQKNNLTDLASSLPASNNNQQSQNTQPSTSQTNTPQATPVSNNPPQNLRDNQVIGSNGEVIDLGRTSDNSSTK